MSKVKLRNRKARMFYAQLENKPKEEKKVARLHHDVRSGAMGQRITSYQTYESLQIMGYQTTEALDSNVLDNPSVSGAVKAGWLQVIN